MSTVTEPAGLTVRVEAFEGPLDLLLHLCRTDEIDLAHLPIRTVTDQYLAHLESIQFRDLEVAGAFMVVAATLIYLKSKLLLPDTEAGEETLDDEGEALRQELENRLREYARVKAQGLWLAEREAEQTLLFGRPGSLLPAAEEIPIEDLSVHLLERAYRGLIEEARRATVREVEPNHLSVLERMGEIVNLLSHTWSLLFSAIVGGARVRAELVVTLLALLELVRLGEIRAQQAEPFGEIVIERPAPEAAHDG